MASDSPADDLLTALGREAIKVKCVYDGSNRLITRYEAFSNAVDAGKCLKTTYTYVGAATQPDKMKEEVDVWSSAYDI